MTFVELRNEVEARADDTSLSDSQINRWINLSYKDMVGRFEGEWPFLLSTDTQNTVANQAAYNLPADFSKSYDLTVQNATTAMVADEYVFVPFMDRNLQGLALAFTINAAQTQFTLHPTPDTAGLTITLEYFAEPLDLVADSDEPVMPNRWHEGIVYFALMRYYQRWREPGMVAHFQELGEQVVQSMIEYYSRWQSAANPIALRSSASFGTRQKSILFR